MLYPFPTSLQHSILPCLPSMYSRTSSRAGVILPASTFLCFYNFFSFGLDFTFPYLLDKLLLIFLVPDENYPNLFPVHFEQLMTPLLQSAYIFYTHWCRQISHPLETIYLFALSTLLSYKIWNEKKKTYLKVFMSPVFYSLYIVEATKLSVILC